MVKDALENGRRALDAEDSGVLERAIEAVQMAAKHLTQVMLMDPTSFLRGLGGDTTEGDGKS